MKLMRSLGTPTMIYGDCEVCVLKRRVRWLSRSGGANFGSIGDGDLGAEGGRGGVAEAFEGRRRKRRLPIAECQ